MNAPLRCISAIGLSVLALAGALSPSAAFATPTTSPTSSSEASTPPAAGSTPSTSVSYQRDRRDFSLSVSPTRLAVGQRDLGATQQVTLINRGQRPLAVTVQKRDFTVGPDGALRYAQDAPYGASSWVSATPKQVTVEPGQDEVVLVTVEVPKAYEPGDHQVALVFMVPADKSDKNITVNRGVGLPMYITAPGPIVDSVSLSGMRAPTFVSGGSVPITATVTNAGTVHHDFRKPSSLTVAAPGTAEPFPDFTVPRDSVRDIATTWDPPFLCICHPTVTMTSTSGGLQSQTVRVIVFPWPWLAAGLGAVLLVLLIMRTSRRRYQDSVRRAATALAAPVSAGDV